LRRNVEVFSQIVFGTAPVLQREWGAIGAVTVGVVVDVE
jgi:hypothetical protein